MGWQGLCKVALGVALVAAPSVGAVAEPTADDAAAGAAILNASAPEVATPVARPEHRHRAALRHRLQQPANTHARVPTPHAAKIAPTNAALRAALRHARVDVALGCTLDGCDTNS